MHLSRIVPVLVVVLGELAMLPVQARAQSIADSLPSVNTAYARPTEQTKFRNLWELPICDVDGRTFRRWSVVPALAVR
jgi:hypothetical protein